MNLADVTFDLDAQIKYAKFRHTEKLTSPLWSRQTDGQTDRQTDRQRLIRAHHALAQVGSKSAVQFFSH